MTGAIHHALWDDGLLQDADVPLTQIEAAIDQMATQLAAANAFTVPHLRAQYDLDVHRLGHAGAQDAFEEWSDAVAERDAADSAPIASAAAAVIGALPWCPHCDLADQVDHLALTGHGDRAAELAVPLLNAAPGTLCPEQPAGVIAAVLPSLLVTGQGERAATEHLLAARLLEPHVASARFTRARAWTLLTAARTGRLQHGLDLLQEWLGWLPPDAPAYARMQLAAAGARVLRDVSEAGQGELLVDGAPGHQTTTADELGARLLRDARELAARFDVRNGTQTATELVDDILDAPDLPDLPLDALLRSPQSAAVAARRMQIPHHRRARPGPVAAPGTTPRELVAEFDAALAADAQTRRAAVMATWATMRVRHVLDVGPDAHDPARLDGWMAIENLYAAGHLVDDSGVYDGPAPDSSADAGDTSGLAAKDHGPLDQAEAAARRLLKAGLRLESLLHEQAALYAAAQSGVVAPATVATRIEAIAGQVAGLDRPADLGLAHSRVALIRELVATSPAVPEAAAPVMAAKDADTAEIPKITDAVVARFEAETVDDAVAAGLAAFEPIPTDDLTHQQARALCRLLRMQAGDQEPDQAMATLEHAVAVLPDGVRPVERALARTDLATLRQETDPRAAAVIWRGAIDDAAAAGAESLLGNVLAAGAGARQACGDVDGAIADLTQAVPLLDRFGPPELAAQARFDLARALLMVGRFAEAATGAESALADLTDLMTAPHTEQDAARDLVDDPALAHIAGCAAFCAAEAVAALGDDVQGRMLAELSAGWHEANGNLVAEAESWQLAARIGGPPRRVASDLERAAELAEAGGEWSRAAVCRRDRATAVHAADGVDAALDVLDEADKALNSRENPAGRHVSPEEAAAASRLMTWHRMAISEQRARLLAVAGRFSQALSAVSGLEDGYTALGDDWSARDLLGLRGQLRAELHDLDGALADLERAAQAAADAGDRSQARGLGERLAMVLDHAGRHWDAEQAYQRFTTS